MSTQTTTTIATTGTLFVLSEHSVRAALLVELFQSYYSARSNKRNTHTQMRFERDLSRNVVDLYQKIVDGTYKPGRSICFIVDRPVKREVFAASFRDRVVHHLLYRYLNPIFEPLFIHDSYSCRVGKGTLVGVERLEHHIRSCSNNYTRPCWVLKMDLSGYFMSIDRQLLYDIVMRTLVQKGHDKDDLFPYMQYLLRAVIFNDPTKGCYVKGRKSDWDGLPRNKSLYYAQPGFGLPIGNLTSQLFSNIYLNELDQFVKRTLGVKHYGRYVDDFYLVDSSRERLLSLVEPIRVYLKQELNLTIHPHKFHLQPANIGVSFLGVYVLPGRRYMSTRSRHLMNERLCQVLGDEPNPYKLRAQLNSYAGHLSHMTESFPYEALTHFSGFAGRSRLSA